MHDTTTTRCWPCTLWCAFAGKMTLSDDVNLEEFVMAKDELSGADIKAVCTEAGLLALRERRMRVTQVGRAPGCSRGGGGQAAAGRDRAQESLARHSYSLEDTPGVQQFFHAPK